MIKERNQTPVLGDTLRLRLNTFNANAPANVLSISKVEIYYLDPDLQTTINPDGRTLVQLLPMTAISLVGTGQYQVDVVLTDPPYTDGRYLDKWFLTFETGDPETTREHYFKIYSSLWYTTPIPVVYDFKFHFQPNKFRMGSKKPIEIEVVANVPTATDLEQYYENLAIGGDLKVYIAQNCGECLPEESDLRLIVDGAPTTFRNRNRAYYTLDTSLFDCGLYDIWYKLEHGGHTYVSDVNQIQIY